jgi:hypothetical protein
VKGQKKSTTEKGRGAAHCTEKTLNTLWDKTVITGVIINSLSDASVIHLGVLLVGLHSFITLGSAYSKSLITPLCSEAPRPFSVVDSSYL